MRPSPSLWFDNEPRLAIEPRPWMRQRPTENKNVTVMTVRYCHDARDRPRVEGEEAVCELEADQSDAAFEDIVMKIAKAPKLTAEQTRMRRN